MELTSLAMTESLYVVEWSRIIHLWNNIFTIWKREFCLNQHVIHSVCNVNSVTSETRTMSGNRNAVIASLLGADYHQPTSSTTLS